ncbi:hypothetical protein J6590_004267 [Homalodisca vitripennis]|nr:hypothetical protein J6590_004267 [Homalodisca vitripennis]
MSKRFNGKRSELYGVYGGGDVGGVVIKMSLGIVRCRTEVDRSHCCQAADLTINEMSTREDRSAVTHSGSSHAERCLSCDNRCTRYTTPLASKTRDAAKSMPKHNSPNSRGSDFSAGNTPTSKDKICIRLIPHSHSDQLIFTRLLILRKFLTLDVRGRQKPKIPAACLVPLQRHWGVPVDKKESLSNMNPLWLLWKLTGVCLPVFGREPQLKNYKETFPASIVTQQKHEPAMVAFEKHGLIDAAHWEPQLKNYKETFPASIVTQQKHEPAMVAFEKHGLIDAAHWEPQLKNYKETFPASIVTQQKHEPAMVALEKHGLIDAAHWDLFTSKHKPAKVALEKHGFIDAAHCRLFTSVWKRTPVKKMTRKLLQPAIIGAAYRHSKLQINALWGAIRFNGRSCSPNKTRTKVKRTVNYALTAPLARTVARKSPVPPRRSEALRDVYSNNKNSRSLLELDRRALRERRRCERHCNADAPRVWCRQAASWINHESTRTRARSPTCGTDDPSEFDELTAVFPIEAEHLFVTQQLDVSLVKS